MNKRMKRYLMLGIVGGILTMIGDCLLLGADSYGAAGGLEQYAVIAQKISYTRIGLAGFFGFIGIPITVFGFYALCMSLGAIIIFAAWWISLNKREQRLR